MRKIFFILSCIAIIFASCSRKNELVVMSFNVRVNVPSDTPNIWKNRLPLVLTEVASVDIVGMQELIGSQYDDVAANIVDEKLFGTVNVNGVRKSEVNGIAFANKKLNLLEQGTFWLSPTPDSLGGKAWDAEYERSVNWGKFSVKESGKIFYFFNTHFDVSGKIAQVQSAKLLLDKVADIAQTAPAIVTGDFNADENSEAIKIITDKSNSLHLNSAANICKTKRGANYSYQAFGKIPENECSAIDFIFVKNGINVELYEVRSNHGELYSSDHYPIVAKLKF